MSDEQDVTDRELKVALTVCGHKKFLVDRFRLRPGENFLETRIASQAIPFPPPQLRQGHCRHPLHFHVGFVSSCSIRVMAFSVSPVSAYANARLVEYPGRSTASFLGRDQLPGGSRATPPLSGRGRH